MIVPGLPTGAGQSPNILVLGASENDVDVFARLNSPAYAFTGYIYVLPGVVIGSSSSTTPGMDFTGFIAGSSFQLINEGRISGAGGAGGAGGDAYAGSAQVGAGGGGGAGTVVGAGGTATSPATAGSAGTDSTGGAHGTSAIAGGSPAFKATEEGENGGDAIASALVTLSIINANGEIWGGGGGGVGGFEPNPTLNDGGDGGDAGEDAEHIGLLASGFAGNAIRGDAANITFVSGATDPNVKGDVGL